MKDIKKIYSLTELENERRVINEMFDGRKNELEILEEAVKLSKMPFPYLKETAENFSQILFESSEGKKMIQKYIKTVKNNKNLTKLHQLCESIRKTNANSDIDFFMNSISVMDFNINKKGLNEGMEELGKVLAESYILLGEKANDLLPENNNSLNKAIEYIAENKKSERNISEYSSAVKIIKEHVSKNKPTYSIFESANLDDITEKLVNDYNDKYASTLSESERKIVKDIAESSNHEELFEKYKNECMNKVELAKIQYEKEGDSESVMKLKSIHEQVSNKKYSENTLNTDINNLIEISNLFD